MRRVLSLFSLLLTVAVPALAQTGAVLTTASVGVVRHVALSAIPANARIVFHTNQVIYTMDAAGGNITQITFNQGRALDHVAVSPDRLRVVASYQVSGIDHLVLFDLVAGTEQELLPHFYAAGAGGVDWDLAGNIYFAGVEKLPYSNPIGTDQLIANAAAYDIYRVKYDGTGTLRVTNTADRGESDVSVSADGTLIAYESTHLDIAHNDPTELWINTVTGTKPQRVYEESSPATRSVHDPELSPDNTKLVFSRVNPAFHNFPLGANTAHDLYTIKTDGTALTLITVPGPISIIPDWKGNSIVYLELSDEAVDYLGVSTISDTGTGHTRINGDANTPKWIETASVPAVPPPAPLGPTPASLRVQKISWSIDANPANDPAIVTAAAYRANTTGQIAAYAKAREAGVDHLQLVVKWNEVEPTLGVYDFSKVDTLVANSGELPLVLNIAPIWDDGNTVLPGGLAFGNFTDAAVVTAYQNMLTALQSHLKGRLYVLIIGNEVDTYLTTASRRAQYAVFLTQIRAWARTLFGVNPFKVTASLRSSVAATWSDWADLDAATDLNCFTYYPTVTSPIENFAPQIQSDLGTMTGNGPMMFQELGLSTTISGSSEALQTAAVQVLSGLIALVANQPSRTISVVAWSGLEDISATVLTNFGYSSGQLTAGIGLRDISDVPKAAYTVMCGFLGGTNCTGGGPPPPPPPACTYTLSKAQDTFTASPGSDTVTLTVSAPSCAWTINETLSWLSVSPTSGTGDATLTYTVLVNSGIQARAGSFDVVNVLVVSASMTIAQDGTDVAPPPAPACTSTTPSRTGRNPHLLWTSCAQDLWNQWYSEYLTNPTSPATEGGKWAKAVIVNGTADNTSNQRDASFGRWALLAYQMTGDVTFAAKAWSAFKNDWRYPAFIDVTGYSRNETREYMIEHAKFYDWLYPYLTTQERADFNTWLQHNVDLVLNVGASGWGTRIGDSDEDTGQYFGIAATDLATGSTNLSRSWVDGQDGVTRPVGGLTATAADTTTLRNTIRLFVENYAAGGQWIESCGGYNLGTLQLLLMGYGSVLTATGVDYFPEITAALDGLAASFVQELTPDLIMPFRCGDVEGTFTFLHLAERNNLANLLSGFGRPYSAYLRKYITDVNTANGYNPAATDAHVERSVYLPMDQALLSTTVGWQTYFGNAKVAIGQGILHARSGWATTDSAVFTQAPTRCRVDHCTMLQMDTQFYRHGHWMLQHPYGYGAIVNGIAASRWDLFNQVLTNNLARSFEAGGLGASEIVDGEYVYSDSINVGFPPAFSIGDFTTVETSLKEKSRAVFWLPDSASDTVLLFDRVNTRRAQQDPNYSIIYPSAFQSVIEAAPTKQWVLHTLTSPTRVGKVLTWDVSTTHARSEWLLPSAEPTYATTLYPASGVDNAGYVTKVSPTGPAQQFDTFLNCLNFYEGANPLTCTGLTSSVGQAAQGALVTRTSKNDAVVMFSAKQGSVAINTTYDGSGHLSYDESKFTTVKQDRFLTTGYTFSYTQTTATGKLYLLDLSPGANWTVNINGAGATPLTVSTMGLAKVTVSGAGAKSVVVIGDGTAPPSDPTDPPPDPGDANISRKSTAQVFGDGSGSASAATIFASVAGGSNGLGMVAIAGPTTDTLSGCTWGAGAMTVAGKVRSTSDIWIYLLYLTAPTVGPVVQITCTFSAPTPIIAVQFGYNGIDQTTPINACATGTSPVGGQTFITGTVDPGRTNTWTVMAARNSIATAAAGSGTTAVYSAGGLGAFDSNGPNAVATPQSLQATIGGNASWGTVTCALNPPAAP